MAGLVGDLDLAVGICTTLAEGFVVGEGIQSGLGSGANRQLTFGRFEGALQRFNSAVERLTGTPDMA